MKNKRKWVLTIKPIAFHQVLMMPRGKCEVSVTGLNKKYIKTILALCLTMHILLL